MRTSFNYIMKNFTEDCIKFYLIDDRANKNLYSSNRDIGGNLIDFAKNIYHIYGSVAYTKNILLHIVEVYIVDRYLVFHIIANDSNYINTYNVNETTTAMFNRLLLNATYDAIYDDDMMVNIYYILKNINIHKLITYFIDGKDMDNCLELFDEYTRSIKKFLKYHNENILITDISEIYKLSYLW